jgi:transformer-2 protein
LSFFNFIFFKIYFRYEKAKKETHGMEIEGQKVRVDFSLTNKPHERTPGIYMGAA